MFFPVFKAQEQSAAAGEVDKGDCLLLTAYGVMCGPRFLLSSCYSALDLLSIFAFRGFGGESSKLQKFSQLVNFLLVNSFLLDRVQFNMRPQQARLQKHPETRRVRP
ncbi:MAG: hypothetical protein HUU32_13335 [Calditrichaceae bacterium]|nr:hypothetical protein [Calditrichaceae bacterium]